MKNLSIMLKPASSACNMRCGYCFYADVSSHWGTLSHGKMTLDTMHRILDNCFLHLEAGDRVHFTFQGGEPTLVGLPFYQDFVAYCAPYQKKGISVSYALQTNGYLLDHQWCSFLTQHHFLVGLSLDGPKPLHDANRLDSQKRGTFRKILQAKNALDRAHTEYNVLTVLTNGLARHPRELWRFLVEQRIGYIQLIPCLGSLDGDSYPTTLTPERYASFYCNFFDLWLDAYRRGQYISVKLFDDLIRLMRFGECNACGLLGFCTPQIVVEGDGRVYPCDFYVLDAYCAGNLAQTPLKEIFTSPAMQEFPKRPIPKNTLCASCPYDRICGGGCPRMRSEVFSLAKDGKCGHRLFLEHAAGPMAQLARTL